MAKYDELKTKTARIAYIREMVGRSPAWAVKALVRIYERQTEDEKNSETTKEHNNIGFTGADANILSSFAKQYQQRGRLSEKQMVILRKRMPKYARQLESIAAGMRVG